ncbi:GTPase HflX [Eggerthellaceae bacterium zg-1084]|uniref:GTPase HflX n=1 Tax=Berryella wangjianweii TaxID=2734634 RepID=UPI001552498E|nr:GTPase HflX [Berryella wangjianweii]NPD30286.1 GTPase HflX [Berryella wangjianweii]NPD32589.1 GTPase HflX [Eggerthellaceae bacterium zg-997]
MIDSSTPVTLLGSGPQGLDEQRERAVLVGVDRPHADWPLEVSLSELERLVDTAGAKVVATFTQRLAQPNPRTLIGSGKVEQIAAEVRVLGANVVVFDDELSPSQQQNLERAFDKSVKVIDRTALILDIFALHATTKEGRLQVRLAQNQYLLPRLRGMWAHLASNRMGGGVGSRFGEGESQLEVDRRMVRKRITSIRRELEHVKGVRAVQREGRLESGVFKVAIAGYTNAGKSTLLNHLADAGVYSDDKLFATLDSTTRRYVLSDGRAVTLTDTVGFIKKLPTTLVEAFRSTLDEISGADLVLQVVDGSSDEMGRHIEAVEEILDQIGASALPRVLVLNKVDALGETAVEALARRYPHGVCISARTGQGIAELLERVSLAASADEELIEVLVPYDAGEVASRAHRTCRVVSERFEEGGTRLTLFASKEQRYRFTPYLVDGDASASGASDA